MEVQDAADKSLSSTVEGGVLNDPPASYVANSDLAETWSAVDLEQSEPGLLSLASALRWAGTEHFQLILSF